MLLCYTGCKVCSSSGVKPGTQPSTCSMCQGTGQLIQAVRTPLGAFQQVTTCGRCEGQGQSFTACEKCGGDGRERENKRIQLTVPAGGVFGVICFLCSYDITENVKLPGLFGFRHREESVSKIGGNTITVCMLACKLWCRPQSAPATFVILLAGVVAVLVCAIA